MEGEGDQDGEDRHLICQYVEEGTERKSPSLPSDFNIPQSLNIAPEVVFKGVELDDLDSEKELFDSGGTGITVPGPGLVTLIDVFGNVCRQWSGQGDAGNSDKRTDAEHRVQEADPDDEGDQRVGDIRSNSGKRSDRPIIDGEEVHDLTSALSAGSSFVRGEMSLHDRRIGSSQNFREKLRRGSVKEARSLAR